MSRRTATHNASRKEIAFNIDAFFTPSTLATRWHRHTESVRRMLRRRQLPSVVLGRQRLIPREAVLEYERAGFIAQCDETVPTNGGQAQ